LSNTPTNKVHQTIDTGPRGCRAPDKFASAAGCNRPISSRVADSDACPRDKNRSILPIVPFFQCRLLRMCLCNGANRILGTKSSHRPTGCLPSPSAFGRTRQTSNVITSSRSPTASMSTGVPDDLHSLSLDFKRLTLATKPGIAQGVHSDGRSMPSISPHSYHGKRNNSSKMMADIFVHWLIIIQKKAPKCPNVDLDFVGTGSCLGDFLAQLQPVTAHFQLFGYDAVVNPLGRKLRITNPHRRNDNRGNAVLLNEQRTREWVLRQLKAV
jgi:hypothetical protein